MSTPEGLVKRGVERTLKQMIADGIPLWWHCPVTGGYGRAGIPDFEGCIEGLFFAIETKAKGGTQTALQMRESMKITAAKGCYLLVDEYNVPIVREMLVDWVTLTRKQMIKSTQTGVSRHAKSKEDWTDVEFKADKVRTNPSALAARTQEHRHRVKAERQQRIRVGGEVADAEEGSAGPPRRDF